MTNDIIKPGIAHFSKMFPDFLGQKGEEIDKVLMFPNKSFTQLFILGGNAHRASIQMTFSHHHTTQNNQSTCCKTKLFGSQDSHCNDILPGFQLSIRL